MTNLLLLLSAMLSALVGAGPVARAAEAPVAVASAARAQATPAAARREAVRPAFALPSPAALIGQGIVILLVASGAAPAWKTRRRE